MLYNIISRLLHHTASKTIYHLALHIHMHGQSQKACHQPQKMQVKHTKVKHWKYLLRVLPYSSSFHIQYFPLLTLLPYVSFFSNAHQTTYPLNPVHSELLWSPSCTILHDLAHIFNFSRSNDIIPNPLKHACRVIPMLKKPLLDPPILIT